MLISEVDYEAWRTARHLFPTPANARRLLGSIEEWQAGQPVTEDLPEDDEADE